jgi:hypothetical protein
MYTSFTKDGDDDNPAALLRYMRPEEDLHEHRRRAPWRGEYRLFRSANVAKLEDHRQPGEMKLILERLRQRERER